ncbi:MAG: DUF2279 domain-containing protein [Bacteroidetes bacterium]|nr:DUF2279 domain-containing protein [Bacteroidota bacterium]
MQIRNAITVLLIIIAFSAKAQATFSAPKTKLDSVEIPKQNNKKVMLVAGASLGLYTTSMVLLNQTWYANYPRSKFHWFDDNQEWLQMDKIGHGFVSYYEGMIGIRMLEWTGMPHRKAAIYGGVWGILMQTPIEVLDGYSSEWGASKGDLLANVSGTALLLGQELAFKRQVVLPKVSFQLTPYAKYRPNVLGSSYPERLLKDYNGQTYWLTLSTHDIYKKLPDWLSLAAGIGADGMIGGNFNPSLDKNNNPYPTFTRQRQYYFSLDVNTYKIKTHNKTMRAVLDAVAFIKFPAPSVEYNATSKKWNLYLLYF